MRVMVIVKATADSEAGKMPTAELIAKMGAFNRALIEAGVMIDGGGLKPTSKGARVAFSGEDRTVANGLGTGHSSFDYTAAGFSIFGGPFDIASGVGHFDALHSALSQGDFVSLGRGGTASLGVSVNEAGFAANPALGWMVVTLDDANGAVQADLVPVGTLP